MGRNKPIHFVLLKKNIKYELCSFIIQRPTLLLLITCVYPDIVVGVCSIARIINETVSSIISFWKWDTQLWVDVFHELPSIMYSLPQKWSKLHNANQMQCVCVFEVNTKPERGWKWGRAHKQQTHTAKNASMLRANTQIIKLDLTFTVCWTLLF